MATIRTGCVRAQCIYSHNIFSGGASTDSIARNRVTEFLKVSDSLLLCSWLLLIG